MRRSLLLLALLAASAVEAQKAVPGLEAPARRAADLCEAGTATALLDVAGVRARLYNDGALFWHGSRPAYEVPKGSGTTAVFAAGLWVGGLVDGELRFAGSTYGPWEFWPGPLDPGASTTPERCAALDRIWTVRTADLEAYDATGASTADLREWPVAWGAPFYTDADGDGRQGPSEPTVSLDPGDAGYGTRTLGLEAGERPVVFGRQTAWWVMNDVGGEHRWGMTEPLGLEARVTAWSLADPAYPNLVASTFYRYELVNRSDRPIEDAFASLYVDPDLGNFNDDYLGSDSTRSLFFVYNGDAVDEGPGGYGDAPPAFGIDVLSGGYGAMRFTSGGTVTSDPSRDAGEAYGYMRSLWKDGTPLRLGGDGYNTNGPPVRWVFPGQPPDYWSEMNLDGTDVANTPSDRRGVVSARVGTIGPGERATVDLALLFAQGRDRLGSVRVLDYLSDRAQQLYDDGLLTALVEEPPAPAAVSALLAPADGAALPGGAVTFEWAPAPGATGYTLEVDTTAAFSSPWSLFVPDSARVTVPADSLPANYPGPIVWRVRSETLGAVGPPSAYRTFSAYRYLGTFTSFEVVANGAGPLDPPEPGALASAGFPTPGGLDPTDRQQTDGTRWAIAASGGVGTFDEFTQRTLRSRGTVPTGEDLEIRFTGESVAYRRFQDGDLLTVPFEVWATGLDSPDDPSDDVRLVPAVLDYGARTYPMGPYNAPNDVFDLSGFGEDESPVSPDADDPQSDWLYLYLPTDASPGEAGYQAWASTAATDPLAHGDEVIGRVTLVGLDLGTAPPFVPALPEPGTVFRIVVSDPLPVARDEAAPSRPGLRLEARPNPTRGPAEVAFGLEVPGRVRLRVVDVLGREVATLVEGPRAAGEHRVGLDASRLAAGVYVVVLEAGGERVARTVTVAR